MARRVALIPEELISSPYYQNTELRLEDEIVSLLDRKKIPDDMKAKLLGQLVMRYQKTVHAPPEPIPVSVQNAQTPDNEKQPEESFDENGDSHEKHDPVMKNILISSPYRFKKYVPMIIEKLKTRNYFWNADGELTEGSKSIKGSSVVDFFAYLFRNARTLAQPFRFDSFLKALKEINIPRTWIVNKSVLAELLEKNTSIKSHEDVFLSENISSPYNEDELSSLAKRESGFANRRRELKSHSFYPKSTEGKKWRRSRSHSPMKKWLEY